jgi:transposase
MPPVNRNAPKRASSSDSRLSMMEFLREFPDDEACLDWLWRERYAADGHHTHCPACDRTRKFHRVKDRPAYDCDSCGHHMHPLAGTIYQKSSTSLHLWFYAMYLMASTRCGISAKQLERELGVTYKTAWRMLNLIRNKLMADDGMGGPLSGEVEIDETYVSGRPRVGETHGGRPSARDRKTPAFGMVERGGRVRASVVPNVQTKTIMPRIRQHVLPLTMVYTDDYVIYDRMPGHYTHRRIAQSQKIYVDGDVHTQTIEGFFSLVKNGIRGTYHSVSRKWLQGYLNEYAWRYNRRDDRHSMFESLLFRAVSG